METGIILLSCNRTKFKKIIFLQLLTGSGNHGRPLIGSRHYTKGEMPTGRCYGWR
ncbi:MAG: hypothetical protein BWX73_02623 [Lentisphaerae bacterium ADurb.Bin082]|nr:MAG: hypothetical protein BWX73_02623 [Lentisphaerae bacterium ADurb.Bin082]